MPSPNPVLADWQDSFVVEHSHRPLRLAAMPTPAFLFFIGLAVLCATPAAVFAKTQPLDVQTIAGSYLDGANGRQAKPQNTLDIVPTSPSAAYFRTHLEFRNDHECNLWGIAHVDGGKLIYRKPLGGTPRRPRTCVLQISRRGQLIALNDGENTCSDFCGEFASFKGAAFPLASRQPIRDLHGVKASQEYRDAVAENDQSKPSKSDQPAASTIGARSHHAHARKQGQHLRDKWSWSLTK
ncbi:hypothetical protein [Phenylobacterium montanum]|uniref:Uncharacterized protein n=1 Tax=Phenylobacterium montanum TaxID=2823693 RepID=A0A975G2G5_9CAUL|nr:hypothetical protein [Caulobacter sp. S6]QUD89481.1 hypothetical protein KCG34_06260 [Caulobacter sp. S6]